MLILFTHYSHISSSILIFKFHFLLLFFISFRTQHFLKPNLSQNFQLSSRSFNEDFVISVAYKLGDIRFLFDRRWWCPSVCRCFYSIASVTSTSNSTSTSTLMTNFNSIISNEDIKNKNGNINDDRNENNHENDNNINDDDNKHKNAF